MIGMNIEIKPVKLKILWVVWKSLTVIQESPKLQVDVMRIKQNTR